jgi:hypothetical protein
MNAGRSEAGIVERLHVEGEQRKPEDIRETMIGQSAPLALRVRSGAQPLSDSSCRGIEYLGFSWLPGRC